MENVFFIIGAQRSGTSWLARTLDAHPDIEMAQPFFPEPKFFLSEEFQQGKEYYFRKYFHDNKPGKKVKGEKSTSYIESAKAAERIKQMFPEAKIVAVFRNPADRAISNYFFSRNNGIETRSLTEVFLENKPIDIDEKMYSVSPVDYLRRGEYLNFLNTYLKLFGRKKIHILLYEEMIKEKEVLNSLFAFLDTRSMEPDYSKLFNVSSKDQEISSEVREYLMNYYQKSNEALEKVFQIDLTIWKN